MMARLIPYIIYLFLIAAYQVILRDPLSIASASINLTALIALIIALYKTEVEAVWFGFAAGAVMAAGTPSSLGWQALFVAIIVAGAFHAKQRLNMESVYSKVLLVAAGVLIHNVLTITLVGFEGFLHRLTAVALPRLVFTTAIAWLFFLVKEEHITYQRVKELF